jgi:hypothetical protein
LTSHFKADAHSSPSNDGYLIIEKIILHRNFLWLSFSNKIM